VLIGTFEGMERTKLTYKEKLSPHGEQMADLMLKEKRVVEFIKLFR